MRGFDYLNYLRQHGFPSPLLDRTRSILVPAFFAFQNIAEKRNGATIYVLMRVNVDSKVPMDFRQYLDFVLVMMGTVGILCSKVNTRFLRIGRSTRSEEDMTDISPVTRLASLKVSVFKTIKG
ncbi:FRG domain-containing protein [Acidocella aminolytica]|uniref:FRG domain-containing protein n=1 Tax=Acidocella aminolytica TaxID=33998 RepID=UPI0038D144B6